MCQKLVCALLILSQVSLSAQDLFSSLYSDLDLLDQEIQFQQNSMNNRKKMYDELQNKLELSQQDVQLLKDISMTQGELLNSYQQKMKLSEAVHQEQLKYQRELGKQLSGWKIGTIILAVAIPVSAGLGAWAGWEIHRAVSR